MAFSQSTVVKTNRHELLVLAATHRLEYRVQPTARRPTVRTIAPVTVLLSIALYAVGRLFCAVQGAS